MSEHQYAAGPRRITHAICQARDAIQSVSQNQKGCAFAETDFKSAYDKIALSWTWKVLSKKNCSPAFIVTMRQLYETSYVISIVNNEQQPRILNKRQNIKRGGSREHVTLQLLCRRPPGPTAQKPPGSRLPQTYQSRPPSPQAWPANSSGGQAQCPGLRG